MNTRTRLSALLLESIVAATSIALFSLARLCKTIRIRLMPKLDCQIRAVGRKSLAHMVQRLRLTSGFWLFSVVFSLCSSSASETHWSLKPLTKPIVPQANNRAWARTPIDRFILAKLEEKGLHPAPAADKRT